MTPLELLAPDLWVVDRPQRAAGFELGHRMTVLRLASGKLLIHSPVALDEETASQVDALGEVAFIVAPSLMHNLHLGPWLDRYDTAQFNAPAGFERRNAALRQPRVLTSDPASFRDPGLIHEALEGIPKINEVVFLHRPSKTLIVADLIFNLPPADGWMQSVLQRANGIAGRAAPSRLFRLHIRRREALRRSLDVVLSWEFDRLVPGHGRVIEAGGHGVLRTAFPWL
ncbi:MAG: DUF4336 domain-containing protein [Candidatus Polarisedimenticolia bacterium]